MAFDKFDLELLSYCRDPDCDREWVHKAHGVAARTIVARREAILDDFDEDAYDEDEDDDGEGDETAPTGWVYQLGPLQTACSDCGTSWDADADRCVYCTGARQHDRMVFKARARFCEAGEELVNSTFNAIGNYVPRSFDELRNAVRNDYGGISDRGIQRALRVLIDRRQVASLTSSWVTPATRRAAHIQPPGFYIRYDSPKLWTPSGFKDLMSVVGDRSTDAAELSWTRASAVACG
jgi:hypothetical protein